MVDLRRIKQGPRWYIDRLEHALILTCSEFGLEAARCEHTGVWVGDKKIAAIGVQVSYGVTWHGFALNCDVDLGWYNHIVPCGITDPDRGVTSISNELGRNVPIAEVIPAVEDALRSALER